MRDRLGLPAIYHLDTCSFRGGSAGAFALPALSLTTWLAVFVATLSAFHAAAAERLLLRPAVVHTVSGASLTNGSVLIEGDKIVAVGIAVPVDGAKVIELPGQQLFPGLIAPLTTLGLMEIDAVRASIDTRESGQFHPEVQSWVAVNPDSALIPVARANGVTHAVPVPQGGIVAGQSALVALDGWTVEQMTQKRSLAMHLYWPSAALDTTPKELAGDPKSWKSLEDQAKERRKKLQEIDTFFTEAAAYQKGRTNGSPIVPSWEAMLPLLRGQIPLVIHANDLREIRAALKWTEGKPFRVVLAEARDAALASDELAKRRIPVIFQATFVRPDDGQSYDALFGAAGQLHKAGVSVSIAFKDPTFNDEASFVRNAPYAAAHAMAYGLPRDEALRSITLNPAKAYGLADRLGSIEPGKEATFIAVDGDILDVRAKVLRIWIAGREVGTGSKHTLLYERYKARPKAK